MRIASVIFWPRAIQLIYSLHAYLSKKDKMWSTPRAREVEFIPAKHHSITSPPSCVYLPLHLLRHINRRNTPKCQNPPVFSPPESLLCFTEALFLTQSPDLPIPTQSGPCRPPQRTHSRNRLRRSMSTLPVMYENVCSIFLCIY
jgi:hypothetical protein